MAVKDHEHFRLKLLFTQKKKIEHENKQIRADRENYKVNMACFHSESGPVSAIIKSCNGY